MSGKTVAWNQVEPARLVIVSGAETYLATRAIRELKQMLRAQYPNLEIHEIDEGGYSPADLLNLAAPSLFNEPRLVLITGSHEALLEDLTTYLDDQAENCFVAIRLPNLVGHAGKIKSTLSSRSLNVVCDEIKRDSDKLNFINQECAVLGVKISSDAARALLQAFSSDLGELAAACSQLCASGSSSIDIGTVNQIFQGRVETNAFKITDAALAGNAAEAIRLYRHGSATGVDNVALVAALVARIRILAKLFNDPRSQSAAIGMAPWQLDKARKELSGFSEQGLIGLVDLAAQTDADVKGASREPDYSVEKLILAMSQAK
jgi:DNA polymerase-3 subunit delta